MMLVSGVPASVESLHADGNVCVLGCMKKTCLLINVWSRLVHAAREVWSTRNLG